MDLERAGVVTQQDRSTFAKSMADLTLLSREPADAVEARQKAVLEKVNAFCEGYERKVREWGGI
eukprot:33503-Eustigmatos_ZCMA.PRE.1